MRKVRPSFTHLGDLLERAKQVPEAPGGLVALYGTRKRTAFVVGDL